MITTDKIEDVASLSNRNGLKSIYNWDMNFKKLKQFKNAKGHCSVPNSYEDKTLARWVNNQRITYRKGALSSERIKRLESLGFEWNLFKNTWNKRYEELEAFYLKYGHSLVPKSFANQTLAMWVRTQRKIYSKGKLSSEKIRRLEALDYKWNPLESVWNKRYEDLAKFHQEYGHCLVPVNYKNKVLANWVQEQRSAYSKAQISSERVKFLESLNFEWNAHEAAWNKKYEELATFHQKNGHFSVPISYKDQTLATWIVTQRTAYSEQTLSSKKIQRLELLGFDWAPVKSAWNRQYQKLANYYQKNGNCLVPDSYKDKKLARWVSTQRIAYNKKTLSSEKIKSLNLLAFEWDASEGSWNHQYKKLTAYSKKHNHCRVPKSYEDSFLARWVNRQRTAYKNGSLSSEKINKLEALGFEWNQNVAVWNQQYKKLAAFYKKNGHSLVRYNYSDKALARWVIRQRAAYKKDAITSESIRKLNELEFKW